MERVISEGAFEPASPTTPLPVQPPSNLIAQAPRDDDHQYILVHENHVYFRKGVPVAKSVTQLLSRYWPKFDPDGVVKEYFDAWKPDKTSKYGALIRFLMFVEGHDEAYAKEAIQRLWARDGEMASSEGTRMHEEFQYVVEKWPMKSVDSEEVRMFRKWLAAFCSTHKVAPWRSEWTIGFMVDDTPLVAGTVDLVLKHVDKEEYWCVDYKRKDPAPKVRHGRQQLLGTEDENRFFTEQPKGTGPFADMVAHDTHKYTSQLNVYAWIAHQQYGVDFRERLVLLQIHPDLPAPRTVLVPHLPEEMSILFALEAADMTTRHSESSF